MGLMISTEMVLLIFAFGIAGILLFMLATPSDARLRTRDREQLWPEFLFYMQDRDHAIAAMTMHMLIHEHWHPDGFDAHEAPFFVVLEQAIEETEGWGPVGAHLYNVSVDAGDVEDIPGFGRGGE